MPECGQAKHRGWVLPGHIPGIDSVPWNGIYDAISNDNDCSTIAHKSYTIHFYSLLSSLAFADHPSDGSECVFANGSSAGSLFHIYRTHSEHQSYCHSELFAHDHHAFQPIGICKEKNWFVSFLSSGKYFASFSPQATESTLEIAWTALVDSFSMTN